MRNLAILGLALTMAACGSTQGDLTDREEYYAGRAVSAGIIETTGVVENDAFHF